MALERIHVATISVDSTKLTIKDTTPLADYVTYINGVSDETSLLTEIGGITLTMTDSVSGVDIFTAEDLIAIKSDLRSITGAEITLSDYVATTILPDSLYEIILTFTFTEGDFDSETNQFFYQEIKKNVAISCMEAEWKDSFLNNSRSTLTKTSLRLKSWLDNLAIADENGLLTEGKNILATLKTTLS